MLALSERGARAADLHTMSNTVGGKKYTDQVIENNRSLTKDNEFFKTRAARAEREGRERELALEQSHNARSKLAEELLVESSHSRSLEESGCALREWVGDLQGSVGDLQARNDALQAKVEELLSAAAAALAERAHVETQLAVARSERDELDPRVPGSAAERTATLLREELARLRDTSTASDERATAAQSALDAQRKGFEAASRGLAVAEAEIHRLKDVLRLAEAEKSRLGEEQRAAGARTLAQEREWKDGLAEAQRLRDAAAAERSAVGQQLAVALADCRRLEERCVTAEAHEREGGEATRRMAARVEAADERHRANSAEIDRRGDEIARLASQLGAVQAEQLGGQRARDEMTKLLEQQGEGMFEEKRRLAASAEAAEARAARLQGQRDEADADRAAAKEQLASVTAERDKLGEMLRKAEVQLADERASWSARTDFAEARVVQLTALRDASQAGKAQCKAQLEAVTEARATLQEQVARLSEEKRGATELSRRLDAREADASEQRVALAAQCSEAREQMAAAQAEKQALQQALRTAEAKVIELATASSLQSSRADGAESRAAEMSQQREAEAAVRLQERTQLATLQEERGRLHAESAAVRAEQKAGEERIVRLETQMQSCLLCKRSVGPSYMLDASSIGPSYASLVQTTPASSPGASHDARGGWSP